MALLVTDCPHCFAAHVSVPLVFAYRHPTAPTICWCAGRCSACHGMVSVRMEVDRNTDPVTITGSTKLNRDVMRVLDVYPYTPKADVPDHVPDRIASLYTQCEDARVRRHWEAAGMTQRRCLELAISTLAPEIEGKLVHRIDKLMAAGVLTKDMGAWAHTLRVIGNEAAHDDVPAGDDIEQAATFLKLFLMYAFTLPKMVELRKAG